MKKHGTETNLIGNNYLDLSSSAHPNLANGPGVAQSHHGTHVRAGDGYPACRCAQRLLRPSRPGSRVRMAAGRLGLGGGSYGGSGDGGRSSL